MPEARRDRLVELVTQLGFANNALITPAQYVDRLLTPETSYEDFLLAETGTPARRITLLSQTDALLECHDACFFIGNLIGVTSHPDSEFVYEFGEDFDASLALAVDAYYRQACALLRVGLENCLQDLYFFLREGYETWKGGKLFVQTGIRLVDRVFPAKYLINRRLKDHIFELSKYLHFGREDVGRRTLSRSYDSVYFARWHQLFLTSALLSVPNVTCLLPH